MSAQSDAEQEEMEVDAAGPDNESEPEPHASSSSQPNATPAVVPSMAVPTAPPQVKKILQFACALRVVYLNNLNQT